MFNCWILSARLYADPDGKILDKSRSCLKWERNRAGAIECRANCSQAGEEGWLAGVGFGCVFPLASGEHRRQTAKPLIAAAK
jgi:hypothetical protein